MQNAKCGILVGCDVEYGVRKDVRDYKRFREKGGRRRELSDLEELRSFFP